MRKRLWGRKIDVYIIDLKCSLHMLGIDKESKAKEKYLQDSMVVFIATNNLSLEGSHYDFNHRLIASRISC